MDSSLPYKISVLLFIRNRDGNLLLMKRKQEPNFGLWSGIGGKLEMGIGESPFQCAIREAREEAGMRLAERDLHLFAMIAEKNYEAKNHWLMFLFDCKISIETLPSNIKEGDFAFHSPDSIYDLPIPETDRKGLWPLYFQFRDRFVAMRANCQPGNELEIVIEEKQ